MTLVYKPGRGVTKRIRFKENIRLKLLSRFYFIFFEVWQRRTAAGSPPTRYTWTFCEMWRIIYRAVGPLANGLPTISADKMSIRGSMSSVAICGPDLGSMPGQVVPYVSKDLEMSLILFDSLADFGYDEILVP